MRVPNAIRTLPVVALLALAACDSGLGTETIARAGDFQLTTDEVVEMLSGAPEIPSDPNVIQAVADYWVDYSLLAWLVNQPGEMDAIDLSGLVDQQRARLVVGRLRDAVIQVDTAVTEEELRQIYDETRPADQVRARHVLLGFPEDATQAQRDSIRRLAEEIRDRARGGESFAELAVAYSEDPGSGPNGGDLGFFGRGMMVPPFDSAAFALPVGEVSDVVETDFGLHVLLVEARESPAYEDLPYSFREQIQWEWITEAEQAFLDQIVSAAEVTVEEGAVARIREITANPEPALSGSQASQVLVRYRDGTYTAAEYRDFVLAQPVELRGQVEMALDEQLEGFLSDLVRDRLLIAEAERRGIQMNPLEIAQAEIEFKQQYDGTAQALGLTGLAPEGSESMRQTVAREVRALLDRVVAGEENLIPLSGLSVPLRSHYGWEISEDAILDAVARIDQERIASGSSGLPAPTLPGAPPVEAPGAPEPATPEPGAGAPPEGNP